MVLANLGSDFAAPKHLVHVEVDVQGVAQSAFAQLGFDSGQLVESLDMQFMTELHIENDNER